MAKHHLAQLDVGRLRYPLGSGEADEFIGALDPVNALVDEAPGFVWRLTDVGGKDSAAIDPAEDLVTNLTVWESREAMWEFTYRAEHREFRQRRRELFRPQADASTVLWWIQAGHIPTPLEGRDRLHRLRESGPTPAAFTFGQHLEPVETQLATL